MLANPIEIMMKTYIKPALEIVYMEAHKLLILSEVNNQQSGGTQLSRGRFCDELFEGESYPEKDASEDTPLW